MKRIKAILYGVGEMGRLMTKLMVEKGVDIVGAIGHVSNIGRDLGEVAGLGYPLNIKISDDADAVLSQRKADIAVIAICSTMEKMYPYGKKCIEHGLNVISLTEEALYPWRSSPELTSELDKLAKENGVTVTGSGIQDVIWVSLISALAGASHTIESVTGQAKCNIDDYGPALAEHSHVGETKDKFYQETKGKDVEPSFFGIALEALTADFGLTIARKVESIEPTTEEVDIECKSLGKAVKKGHVTGTVQITEIETEQGINFRAEWIAKLYQKGEVDTNRWIIKGCPDIYLENEKLAGRIASGTTIVNRIPDVINSEPGFITVERLPKIKFRALSLHHFLKN